MRKFLSVSKPFICLIICMALFIAFGCMAFKGSVEAVKEDEVVLTVWQVDSFEGGRGSRADFLQTLGKDFAKTENCYVNVISLSADAVRLNISAGNLPDLISYGAGTYGIENVIEGYGYWCYGGYCLLTLDTSSDFSDVSNENTVINAGKDNLSGAAALFCGLEKSEREKSTGAYVKLINGDFKYLLGTQRDIFRLKTREVSFSIKPLTEFNDLYQNISVIAESKHKEYAKRFSDYILSKTADATKLGLMSETAVYDDEMKFMQGVEYEYRLTSPVSLETRKQLENAILQGDINILKNLLK